MKKSILSLLLTFALVVSGLMPVYADTFSDIEDANCADAVEVLSSLGIVEGKAEGKYEPLSSLTRAEMTTILMRTMGVAGANGGKDIFADVKSTHWAYGNITAAYEMGIISGMGENTFAPDAAVTYAQAIKMVVCVLGYDVHAENLGGYPSGYLSKASQLGILKGITVSDSPITRGEMAILLANALDVPVLEREGYGSDETYKESDKTILNLYLHIYKYEGVITGNYYSSVDGRRSNAQNEIILNNTVFRTGNTDTAKLVGKKVALYAQKNADLDTLDMKAVIMDSRVNTLKIDSADISPKTTKEQVVYTDIKAGGEKKVTISGAKLIWNGGIKAEWTAADLMPEGGSLTLISNSADVDYIFVNSYKNYVVSGTVPEENTVYFKSTTLPYIVIDMDDTEKRCEFINADGSAAIVDDCDEWDVLSISESADGKSFRIVRSDAKLEGEVTEIFENEVRISNKLYKISPDYTDTISIGDEAYFSLDMDGKIAAADRTYVRDGNYGFVVNATEGKGVDKNPFIKIFTDAGEMIVFDFTEKVKVSGEIWSKQDILKNTNLCNLDGTVINQLVKYRTNGDGTKISEIMTEGSGNDHINKFMYIDGDQKADGEYVPYVGGTLKMFASKWLVREKTCVIVTPADLQNEKGYSIIAPNALVHGSADYKKMSFYDADENNVIGAILMDRRVASGVATPEYPTMNATVALVTEIRQGMDAEGVLTTNLKLYNWVGREETLEVPDGFEDTYIRMANTNPEKDKAVQTESGGIADSFVAGARGYRHRVSVDTLNVGDMIQYTKDTEGKVAKISIIFRAETPGNYELKILNATRGATTAKSNYGGILVGNGIVQERTEYGILTKVNQYGASSMKANPSNTFERMYIFSGQLLEFDMEKKTLREISKEEFNPGDVVVSIWRTTAQRMLIKYKNMVLE